jgi:hypothetical protein
MESTVCVAPGSDTRTSDGQGAMLGPGISVLGKERKV